jgi:hypothetical protein
LDATNPTPTAPPAEDSSDRAPGKNVEAAMNQTADLPGQPAVGTPSC